MDSEGKMKRLWNLLFGCAHKHCGFPITIRRGEKLRTYTVCLDCGKETNYDWQAMKSTDAA